MQAVHAQGMDLKYHGSSAADDLRLFVHSFVWGNVNKGKSC
jgi:hypothetical protein